MILELCLVLLLIYVLLHFVKPRGNLPPGPRGIPFLGSLPNISVKHCAEGKKKYGNLFMERTGAVNFLYICDYKLSKEALSKIEFAGRPQWKTKDFEWDNKGLVHSNGTHWVHSRRFALRHLRDLGMGKSKIEGLMMREIEDLVEDFKKLTKEPSMLPFSINMSAVNIVWQLVANHRFDFKDTSVEDLAKSIRNFRNGFMLMKYRDYFPIIEYVIPKSLLDHLIGENVFYKMRKEFQTLIQPFIDEHLKTLDPINPRDFIDDYLIELAKRKSEENSYFSIPDLLKTTFDLFGAGTAAIASMTRWFITYMARFQEIQEKIQLEIDRVVPRDRLPGLQHRNELAYLEATINEVHRHSSFVITSFRHTTEDVELDGYNIPKGTVVIPLAALIHKDPTYFKNPDKFDPSRFLDENGKYIPTCDGFMAFGIGKRQCIGEQFTRMELFLIIASLLQNFTFGPPDGETEISLESRQVQYFLVCLEEQKFSIKYRK